MGLTPVAFVQPNQLLVIENEHFDDIKMHWVFVHLIGSIVSLLSHAELYWD